MANELTTYAVEGQQAGVAPAACPYLHSSDAWLAWNAGWHAGGMSTIRRCHKSRGYSVRMTTAGGGKLLFKAHGPGPSNFELIREG